MIIKHWQGYGSVNAKVVKKTLNTQRGVKTITIEVTGNHEWGLKREDRYDVYNWLLKRFDKNCDSYSDILSIKITSIFENGIDKAIYYIEYEA